MSFGLKRTVAALGTALLLAVPAGWWSAVAAAVLIVSDTFNRADESPATGWTNGTPGNGIQVSSNAAIVGSDPSFGRALFDAASTVGNDQVAWMTIKTFNDAGYATLGPMMRSNAGGTTGYLVRAGRNIGGQTTYIWDAVDAANIVNESATTWTANDVLGVITRGSNIYVFRNGVMLLVVSDASTAGGDPGLEFEPTTGGSTAVDAFTVSEVQIASVASGTEGSAASGSVTPGAPGSAAPFQLWVAACHTSDQGAWTAPAGWTQWVQGNGGSTTSRLAVFAHRYTGTAPSTTFSHTGGQSPICGISSFASNRQGYMVALDACGSISGGTDASMEHTTVTPTYEPGILLNIYGAADDNNVTTQTGYTVLLEDSGVGTNGAFVTTAGTPDGMVGMMWRDSMAGATPTITWTQAAADPWASVQCALKVIPVGVPGLLNNPLRGGF